MTTEETLTPDVKPEVNGNDTAVSPAVAQNTDKPEADHMIPKSRFDEVNTQLKQLKAQQDKLAKERDEAARKAAEEQGEFKKLYETVLQEKQAAEARAKALELSTMRRDIAAKVGIPAGLASRLQGDTEDDIEADAKQLLATLPKPAAPSLDGAAGRGSQNSNAPSLDEIKEQAARYGLNWQHLAKQYGVTVQ